jgi:multidrug efflux pump subunit AcrA (membrane-fusion protein)
VIDVTEKEISLFRKGTKATAHWEGQDYSGEVTSVGYAMNDRTGAFEAELEFANPERWMKFNINAQIEVEVYNNPQAVVVEKQHLLSDSGGDYVFVESGGRAHKRYLELGKASGLSFEVLEGLQAGDQLVVEGKTLLEDGSKLRINGAGESN